MGKKKKKTQRLAKNKHLREKIRVNLQKLWVSELGNYPPELSRKDNITTKDMCNYQVGSSPAAVGCTKGTGKKDNEKNFFNSTTFRGAW